MSDGDTGQSRCLYIVGDCLTLTPHPLRKHTPPSPHTHTQTHTTAQQTCTCLHLFFKILPLTSPRTRSWVHTDPHSACSCAPVHNGLRTIRSECCWHENKANELGWRLKRSTMSAPINLPIVTFDAFTIERLNLREMQFSPCLPLDFCVFSNGLF